MGVINGEFVAVQLIETLLNSRWLFACGREQLNVKLGIVILNLLDKSGRDSLIDLQTLVLLGVPKAEVSVSVDKESQSDDKEQDHYCPRGNDEVLLSGLGHSWERWADVGADLLKLWEVMTDPVQLVLHLFKHVWRLVVLYVF